MTSNDDSARLVERVKQAVEQSSALRIVGGNTKAHLGNTPMGSSSKDSSDERVGNGAHGKHEPLSMLEHTGVISYDPTELVVTVRSGTLLSELNQCLSDAGQMLPFEPPAPEGSTIGGALACGLSGPRRPFSGSARDYVLGTRIINGQAQDLSFGGQVMKNVAGYDVSRVQIGAWGTLGVLLDVSMKVLPLPECELTLRSEMPRDVASGSGESFSALMRQPLPLSGAMVIDGKRYLRLSGNESAVQAAARQLGGESMKEGAQLWESVRNQTHPFFTKTAQQVADGCTLWRISVADHAPPIKLAGDWLHEWAGAQRWLITAETPENIFAAADAAGGHAVRYESGQPGEAAFQPLSGAMQTLQGRLRDSFDQHRIFNRGRFHPELDEVAISEAATSV